MFRSPITQRLASTPELCSSSAARPLALLTTLALLGASRPGLAMSTNVQVRADVAVKETYDSNVFIQDTVPTNNVPGAVQPKRDSAVSTVSPRLYFDYTPSAAFKATLSYTPDFTWYHSAQSEDNSTHRFGANAGGTIDQGVWDMQNAFTYIDGSTEGPTFARPGDIPAIGGIPLRDRRAAFIYRSGFRWTETLDKWMIRPVATAYVHDFKTDLRPSPAPTIAVYENYIDRQDINGGLDLGYEVAKDLRAVLGYRYGRQDQFNGPFGPGGAIVKSPFANTYHRILLGAEGTPLPWLKLGILAGPDIRQFDNVGSNPLPAGFDSNEMLYYVDGFVSFLPTKQDSITLSNKRFEQPAFSSFSMYEDITYDLTWKHKFSSHWAASAGFRIYIGDWQAPVSREDWIYTPSASVAYTWKKLAAELAYSYDWVENKAGVAPGQTAYADGREFTRHLVSLSVKYSL
jgi:hypothetical protein